MSSEVSTGTACGELSPGRGAASAAGPDLSDRRRGVDRWAAAPARGGLPAGEARAGITDVHPSIREEPPGPPRRLFSSKDGFVGERPLVERRLPRGAGSLGGPVPSAAGSLGGRFPQGAECAGRRAQPRAADRARRTRQGATGSLVSE